MDACCAHSGSATASLYAQVVLAGFTWVALHCAGMCGPVVASLGLGRGRGWAAGAAQLGLYQLGRMLPLAAAGALAGWLGDELTGVLQGWTAWAILAVAAALVLAALIQLGWLPWFRSEGRMAARLVRPVVGWSSRHPYLGYAVLGLVLSLLPCGVIYWVLTLAAVSGDAIQGAGLMATLVALTTVPLAIAAACGGLAWGGLRARFGRWVPPVALAFSAVWMSLHAGAMLGWLPHLALGPVMLW